MNSEDKIVYERYLAKLELLSLTQFNLNASESTQEKNAVIDRAKKDYKYMVQVFFPHYASSETPFFHTRLANKIKKKKKYKGLVRWGRGLAKSVVCDITVPFWLWINNDIKFMVLVGENETKAKILLGDLQAEFESNAAIIHYFGEQKKFGFWEQGFFQTKNGFIAKALGMGQEPRGLRVGNQRPDYISGDDLDNRELAKNPARCREMANWILRSLIPTMDDGNRRVVIPNNYFAPVTIQEIIRIERPQWDLDQVDAYDPETYEPIWKEKYTAEHYKYIAEEEIGTLAALSEYCNKPHIEGTVFKDEMIQWGEIPRIDHFDAIVAHWDVAYAGSSTSDYNAVVVMGIKGKLLYIIKVFCRQCKMITVLKWMINLRIEIPASVHINFRFESQFWNDSVRDAIADAEEEEKTTFLISQAERPVKNKLERIMMMHPLYQNTRIIRNIKEKGNNDMQTGVSQLKGIEPGYKTHDDEPDAEAAAAEYLLKYIPKNSPLPITGKRQQPKGAY